MNKTIKAALITGIATIVAGFIGGMGYGKASEQKYIQNEINEVMGDVVNIIGNGNEVTINSVKDLVDEYLKLQSQNKSLLDQNSKYFSDLTEANKKIDLLNNKIQSLEIEPQNNNDNNTVKEWSFNKVCEAFERSHNASYDIRTISCQGIEYGNCIYINSLGGSNIIAKYNLNNKYSVFKFTLGKVDKEGNNNCIINFYIDGQQLSENTINQSADSDIKEYEVPLNYGKIFEIEYTTGHTGYALINATIQ